MTNSVTSHAVAGVTMPAGAFLASQRIVLCRPAPPRNIGAVARAMKTMGLVHASQLVLVNPLCEIDEVAIRRASGAAELVQGCRVVADLASALDGCRGAFGMTVRARELGPEPMSPRLAVATSHALWVQGDRQGNRQGNTQGDGVGNEWPDE